MADHQWMNTLLARNAAFRTRVEAQDLPVARTRGRVCLITCMDPRVNLEALGVEPFDARGGTKSDVRIIRTIGAIPEDRSLIVGIHLAGISEFAIVMHTDCGDCLAKQRITTINESLTNRLDPKALADLKARVGERWPASLVEYLRAFDDPREAVVREVASLRRNVIVPPDVTIHGLVYTLATGVLEVVVNGYAEHH
jgi:carbonic anhydrase